MATNFPIEAEADDMRMPIRRSECVAIFSVKSELGSSTTSIGSSILAYRTENGRTYHSYKEGKYLAPNDEAENDRLDLQHHLSNLTFNNKLIIAPIPKEKVLNRVLDVGTGTGIWAVDFADEHPESQVLGCDLSPIQPAFLPPNLSFEVDDIEETWTYSQPFDLIHSRMMTGSLADWSKFFAQAFTHVAPGGWIQMTDAVFPIRCDDGTMATDSAYLKWSRLMLEGTQKVGRDCDCALKYKEQMEAAGFVDVKEEIYKWPTNRWPKDPKMRELGIWQFENYHDGLESMSLAIFTRIHGWSPEELTVFLADVRKDMKDLKIHSYLPIYVVYGRKPEPAVVA